MEDSTNYNIGEEAQIIDGQLEGLKIPEPQRNFDIGKKKKNENRNSQYIRRLKKMASES